MRIYGPVVGLAFLALAGCFRGPRAENPIYLRTQADVPENPITIPPCPGVQGAYPRLFEYTLTKMKEHFEIAYANIQDGRIVAVPRIAPGLLRFWEPGSPDVSERALASVQTYRYRCVTQIRPSPDGGYLISVTVFKDLLDAPRPLLVTNPAIFRDTATVDRDYNTIDAKSLGVGEMWIPKGREPALESVILSKIQRMNWETKPEDRDNSLPPPPQQIVPGQPSPPPPSRP